jgi:uncharacterized protein (TIGR02996 family)
MDEREALIQTIIDNLEDDVPRLVFADWQEEHGQTAHAELIRVQCALARLAVTESEQRKELQEREMELLSLSEFQQSHGKGYKRGFIQDYKINAIVGPEPANLINVSNLPLDRILTLDLCFGRRDEDFPSQEWMRSFVKMKWLNRITLFGLWYGSLDRDSLWFLSQSVELPNLTLIDFSDAFIPIESIADFLLQPRFQRLTTIQLRGFFTHNGTQVQQGNYPEVNAMVRQVVMSSRALKWKYLTIYTPGIGEEGMMAVLESPYLDNIEELDFGQSFISGLLAQRLRERFATRISLPWNIA